jgi:hypothetical protein
MIAFAILVDPVWFWKNVPAIPPRRYPIELSDDI